jgi:hypothetical protein
VGFDGAEIDRSTTIVAETGSNPSRENSSLKSKRIVFGGLRSGLYPLAKIIYADRSEP